MDGRDWLIVLIVGGCLGVTTSILRGWHPAIVGVISCVVVGVVYYALGRYVTR
jgi:hypothetical protein